MPQGHEAGRCSHGFVAGVVCGSTSSAATVARAVVAVRDLACPVVVAAGARDAVVAVLPAGAAPLAPRVGAPDAADVGLRERVVARHEPEAETHGDRLSQPPEKGSPVLRDDSVVHHPTSSVRRTVGSTRQLMPNMELS